MDDPGIERVIVEDAALEGGEWLFQRGGQVFGPVGSRRLAALLYQGEVEAGTPVSGGDGRWHPLAELPGFLVHVRRAEAARRVEAEVTGQRLLRRRRRRLRLAVALLGTAAVIGGALLVARLAARRGLEGNPLLEDFGAGIAIASPARVALAAPVEEEVEVPLDEEPPAGPAARPASRRAGRAAPGTGEVGGGELVAAQFDAGAIQAVVARQQRGLAPCLREEAGRNPDLGEVPLEFTIGNDGRVVRVAIPDPRLREGALRECFARVLGAWRFAPFPGQRPTVSLAFRVGR